jgi:type II secretory pathway pseudopilin PulG
MTRRPNQQIDFAVPQRATGAFSQRRLKQAFAPDTAGINPAARWAKGSTLTEVLVALMIASIGLVSVATLFPMSVLRSVKAAQTTSATDVRYNAEEAMDRYSDIIKHPDSRNPLYALPYPPAPYPAKPTGYTINDVDPPWLQMQLQGVKNYIVDPLGYAAVRNLNLTIGTSNPNAPYLVRPEHYFGNDPSGGNLPPWPLNPPGTPWQILPRYPLTWRPAPGVTGDAALAAADYLVTLPDSWVLQYETTAGGLLGPGTTVSTYSQVTLPGMNFTSSVAGNPFPSLPSPTVRLVMFSADGTLAQTRNVTAMTYNATNNSTTFQWTEDLNGSGTLDITGGTSEDVNSNGTLDTHFLPTTFAANTLGRVRVELQERRYTWLLTVRQSSTTSASVDVVVYFKRTLENIATDELLYNAVFHQGSAQVTVTYPTGNNPTTGLPLKPYMKRGGFAFDANNAFWYRINNVSPVVASGTGWEQVNLTLEVPANASNDSPPFFTPRGMFPRGVVDVYPLGTKTFQ